MDGFRVDLKGDRQVGLRFEEFPDALYQALLGEVDALTHELLGLVEAATPSRTGKLRASEQVRIFADKQHIKGQVTVSGDFAKAAALEYGAHRPTKVRAHGMRLDHAWANALGAPIEVMVSAYSRTPNIEAARFERGPLAEMQPEIVARLEAVVDKTVAAANR